MRSAEVSDIGVGAAHRELSEKWRRQTRHVAGYHQHLFRWRLHQRRVEATERPSPHDAIHDHTHACLRAPRPVARNDQDVRGEAAQQRQLPVENSALADGQRALVDSAESPRLASGKNGCGKNGVTPDFIRP